MPDTAIRDWNGRNDSRNRGSVSTDSTKVVTAFS